MVARMAKTDRKGVTAICIIDTSVFCNILGVPNRSQQKDDTLLELEKLIRRGTTLLLPMATIYETGNHIAQNGDGRVRRQKAEQFVDQVRAAFSGDAPWTPTPLHDVRQMLTWLEEFPDWVKDGSGFGDLSIQQIYAEQCLLHQARRVYIWSYDAHLRAYDRPPRI